MWSVLFLKLRLKDSFMEVFIYGNLKGLTIHRILDPLTEMSNTHTIQNNACNERSRLTLSVFQ